MWRRPVYTMSCPESHGNLLTSFSVESGGNTATENDARDQILKLTLPEENGHHTYYRDFLQGFQTLQVGD